MTRLVPVALISATLCIFSGVVQAGTFTFSFDSLVAGTMMTGGGTDPNGSIQNYMNNILGAAGSVAVTGVNGGAVANIYYNGDGHVVNGASGTCAGNGSSSLNSAASACAPTLGYNPTTHTAETFLKSFSSNGQPASFNFTFALANTVIDSVSFDYEIFPDGTCLVLDGNGPGCGGINDPNKPDLIFSAGTGTNLGQVFHDYGATPAANSKSYVSTNEKAPQKLVLGYTNNGSYVAGATSFTFSDWPATIGIDNFSLTYHTTGQLQPVPEPTSIILLGTIVLLVYAKLRRTQQAKSHT